jgi:serine/threonine protein kinase
VFKATYHFDQVEYAIKKIVIPASKVNRLREVELAKILKEICTLARLDHHYVVRYHHAWVEQVPAGQGHTSDSDSDSR